MRDLARSNPAWAWNQRVVIIDGAWNGIGAGNDRQMPVTSLPNMGEIGAISRSQQYHRLGRTRARQDPHYSVRGRSAAALLGRQHQDVWGDPEQHGIKGHWVDPIGAAYAQWREMNDRQRVTLMLETAIDLAMNSFDLGDVLREFAEVRQFRALGEVELPNVPGADTSVNRSMPGTQHDGIRESAETLRQS
jgi:hypothetical protein